MHQLLHIVYASVVSIVDRVLNLPKEPRYFLIAAITMLLFSIVAMAALYLRRWQMNIKEKRKAALRFRYQYFIYDAIAGKQKDKEFSSVEMIVNRFKREELNTTTKKQIMIDLLIELKQSFSGESARQFAHLYTGLGLHNHSIKLLSSTNHINRIKGMREMSELDYHCSALEKAIAKWQNSEDQLLANEARLAALRSNSSLKFGFLKDNSQPVDEWLYLQIHRQLTLTPSDKRPLLAQWLKGNNPHAIRFILSMIRDLEQYQSVIEVIPLLYHTDDKVKLAAIHCLEYLSVKEAASPLFNVLDSEDEQLRIAAIVAIGHLGKMYHSKLLRPLLKSDSPLISEAALNAINKIEQRDTPTKGFGLLYPLIK